MKIENILKAKQKVLRLLDKMTINGKIYQGKIDITEYINFAEIADKYNLSSIEYEELINDTQEIVNKAVEKYFDNIKRREV